MAETSARDALLAEILGDVGKLHDEIGSLNQKLPEFVSHAEAQLSPIVGSLVSASKALQASSAVSLQQAKDEAAKQLKDDAHRLTNWYSGEIGKAAAKVAEDNIAASMKKASAELEQTISKAQQAAERLNVSASKGQSLWPLIGVALFAGVLGGMATHFSRAIWPIGLSEQDASYIRQGKTFEAIWPKLDTATRKRITELAEQK